MNNERLQSLADYMSADENRAEALFSMSAEEAVKAINADGNDFTVDELKDLAKGLESVSEGSGELSEEALDNVSGGFVATCTAIYCAAVGVYAGATALRAYGRYKGYWR